MNKKVIKDPRSLPSTKIGRKISDYDLAPLPEDYDDAEHGPPPYFVKYEGLVEKIVDVLEMGGTQDDAAVLAGVSKDTLKQWLRRGRRAREKMEEVGEVGLTGYWDKAYISLVEILETKDAEQRLLLMQRIKYAGEDNWQANAWILERVHGFTTGRNVTHKHVGEDGGAIRFTLDLGERSDSVAAALEAGDAIEAEYEEID